MPDQFKSLLVPSRHCRDLKAHGHTATPTLDRDRIPLPLCLHVCLNNRSYIVCHGIHGFSDACYGEGRCVFPPSRNSDLGAHSRLFSTLPTTGTCLGILSREGFSTFFTRELTSNRAYPSYNRCFRQLVSFKNKDLHTCVDSNP